MELFFTLLRKTIFATIVVVFAFAVIYTPQEHNQVPLAEAGGIVFDPTNYVPNWGSFGFDGITSAVTTSLQIKELALDRIAWAIAKQMISNMVDSTVDWINSGFQGSPAFVQDIGNFVLQAADEAVGKYLEDLDGIYSFICEPFRLDVRLALAITYDGERIRDQGSCTVSDMIGNVEDFGAFMAGDFERGGWGAWFELVSNPNQTPYGAVLEADLERRFRISNAQGEVLVEADWGNGFLSGKLCEDADSPGGNREICQIVKPGRVLSDQLNKALGAGQDQLIAADEIDEIVSALIGQLAQRAITGAAGLLGLSGNTGYTPYSRGSFVNEVVGGDPGIVGAVNPTQNVGDIVANPIDTVSAPLTNRIFTSLTTQQTFLTQVDSYLARLEAFANDPNNSDVARAQAQASIFEARTLSAQITQGLSQAGPIVNEYTALETEYTTADSNRQIEIRVRQSELIQLYSAVGLPAESQISATLSRWETILNFGGGPSPFLDPCDSVQFDPDCIRDGTIRI